MARFPQIGNSSPYTKKIYINLKQNANKQGKKVHTQKKTVIKSVLVTDISCRFYDMTKLL